MLRGKRGMELPLWVIIELVLLGVIIAFFLFYINDIKKDTYFEKTFVAKDLAFLLQKIQSSPGNIKFHYFQENFQPENYDFSFDKNYVGIFEPGNYNYKIGYPFFTNTHLQNNFKGFEQPIELFIKKTKETIEFTNQQALTTETACEGISLASSEKTQKTIVFIANDEAANVLTGIIAEQLDQNKYPLKKTVTTKGNIGFDITQIQVDDDVVVELSIDKSKQVRKDELKITYGLFPETELGKSLACRSYQALSKQFDVFAMSVQPTQESLLTRNPNGAAIHIQLTGGEEATATNNLPMLAQVITDVLEQY